MIDPSTIASLASAPGTGAVALLRMSGPDCLSVLSACTPEGLPHKLVPRVCTLTRVLADGGHMIDQVLVTWFKAPSSYTGEDVVEISCHGGTFVAGKILDRLYECGATPAEPGEFTKRAFLNGRMDLTQAEAVMDVISASGDLALRAAGQQLDGAIGKTVRAMTDRLVQVLAHIEAYIDFPDEDISPDTAESLSASIAEAISVLTELLKTSVQGKIFREGVKTVIAGRPNVGKSSLLNLLLGYERAIVSDVAGTTRDTVEEVLHMGGLALRLIDTAGLRQSADGIEQEGMKRTTRAIDAADLVIEVVDASRPGEPLLAGRGQAGVPVILVLNKTDLGIAPEWEGVSGVRFSCAKAAGRGELEEAVVASFADKIPMTEDVSLASVNARHQQALARALEALDLASDSLKRGDSPELTALELREALDGLGSITGKVDTEDILGAIFSSFCIGK